MGVFKTVLETFSNTSNADTNIKNGVLQISNQATGMPASPTIGRPAIRSIAFQKALQETPYVVTISWTIANATEYQFRYVAPNGYTIENFYFVSATTGATNADLGNAIASWAASSGAVSGTYSSGASITLTALTGMPLFGIQTIKNITATSAMPTLTPNATPATALSGTTTVTVTVTGGTFKTGETVAIASATGFTFTDINGIVTTAAVTARIIYASATTFTLDGITGSGTNTGTITITKVAQPATGTKAIVDADMAGYNYSADSTQSYDKMVILDGAGNEYNFWLKAYLTASPFTATANLSQFYADMIAYRTSTSAGNVSTANILGLKAS